MSIVTNEWCGSSARANLAVAGDGQGERRMVRQLRAATLVTLAALMLSGCISTLDGMYEDQARRQCEESEARHRGECHDRVDRQRQQQRERDRD